MPIDRIAAINAKIERAKKHIGDLESAIKAFFATQPYKIVADDNLKAGRRCLVVGHASPIPFEIPSILGDALQNLRSALDHLIYHLVIANTGSDPNDKMIMFPIFDDPAKYKAGSARKVRGANQKAINLIEALKPYRGGNDSLWGLNELNNIDKHRLLLTVGHYNAALILDFGSLFRLIPCPPGSPISFKDIPSMTIGLVPADKAVEQGSILYDFPINDPMFEENNKAKFTIGVAFGESEIFKGQAVAPTLQQLLNLVEGIIKTFHPFL